MNILGEGTEAISDCFAGAPSALPRSAFCDADYALGECGLPILEAAIAYVGCEVERVIPAGDHTMYIGARGRGRLRATTRAGRCCTSAGATCAIERAATADLRGKPDRVR